MRLRCTFTQRRPTRRSKLTVTRGLAGIIVPDTRSARRRRGRELPIANLRLGTTLTAIGADSMRGREPSPGKTARSEALCSSVTLEIQLPSHAATVLAIGVHADPAAC